MKACDTCGGKLPAVNQSGRCRPCKDAWFRSRNIGWAKELLSGVDVGVIAARDGYSRQVILQGSLQYRQRFPKRTVASIIEAACKFTLFSKADIIGERRWMQLARVRQAVCYLAVEAGNGYKHTGRALGRDHSTVIHACQKVEILLKRDPNMVILLNGIRDGLPARKGMQRPIVPPKIIQLREPVPEPEQVNDDELDDVELLQLAVARYVAEQRAAA